jgi:hypothetical protein
MTGDDTVRLTYAELAEARGVSLGAARRMVQRHKWPKQVGNDGLSRISVPATFLTRSDPVNTDIVAAIANDVPTNVAPDVPVDAAGLQVIARGEAVVAFADVGRDVAADVATDVAKDVIATLREQLMTERERADRAEDRAREAENRTRETEVRVRELTEQLQAEMIEHRRMVALLLKRRFWWPWRR